VTEITILLYIYLGKMNIIKNYVFALSPNYISHHFER